MTDTYQNPAELVPPSPKHVLMGRETLSIRFADWYLVCSTIRQEVSEYRTSHSRPFSASNTANPHSTPVHTKTLADTFQTSKLLKITQARSDISVSMSPFEKETVLKSVACYNEKRTLGTPYRSAFFLLIPPFRSVANAKIHNQDR